MGVIEFLIFAAALAMLPRRREMVDALIEAIDNFRGGPPTPMHPSPANDGALLRRRRRKAETADGRACRQALR
jgi:hypothetical protein